MGYLIEAATAQQIVNAKITLTSVELLDPGYIIDIPEYPAVPGAYWQVLSMNGLINNGTTPYVGISQIHVQARTAATAQFRFAAGYMGSNVNTWSFATELTGLSNPQQFVVNSQLQIHNPGTITVGDFDLNIYITAILITQ